MWPLSFDRAPAPFAKNDFPEDAPAVTVYGNLVDAIQGKAEREAVLGNGDSRQSFQTFTLPKAPLTYFLCQRMPRLRMQPELEIWVDRRLVDARGCVLRPWTERGNLHRARGRGRAELRAVR